jgi:hypothetical protein
MPGVYGRSSQVGRNKGYALFELHPSEADAAIAALDGEVLAGRNITVSRARAGRCERDAT